MRPPSSTRRGRRGGRARARAPRGDAAPLGTLLALIAAAVAGSGPRMRPHVALAQDGPAVLDLNFHTHGALSAGAAAGATASITGGDGVEDAGCRALLQRAMQLQERWRAGEPGAAAPLVHYASLRGQGFGRLLEHALETFVFATLLDRPFVLDIRSRDLTFTWRSFFTHGDYNWRPPLWMEPLLLGIQDQVAPNEAGAEIRDGGAGLPPGWFFPGASEDERRNATRMGELVSHEWHARGPRGSQIAVVPNWGTSTWFLCTGVKHMVFQLMANYRCPGMSGGGQLPPGYGRWYGLNFLFKPTVLAWEVYRNDRASVLGDGHGDGGAPFGAIHLRTENVHGLVQLREGPEELTKYKVGTSFMNKKTGEAIPSQIVTSMARDLRACLQSGIAAGVGKWWLLSDNVDVAQALAATEELKGMIVQGYHANYSATNAHSNNAAAKGLFGHSLMASSVSDWMAIWDSAVAFVGDGSAYGMTAAVGTGKACRCASHNVDALPATVTRCDTAESPGSREGQLECPVGRSKLLLCARRGTYARSLT